MHEIMAIASSVWRRYLRLGVVYFLVISALIIIAAMNLYGTLTMGEERALMVDMSMFMTTLAGFLAALTVAFDMPREIREGVASTLLVKPLGRTQYLAGKLIGTAAVAIMVAAVVSVGFFVILKLCHGTVPLEVVQSHALILASMIPVTAVALLFASFLGEAVAALLTLLVVWLGFSAGLVAKLPLFYGGVLPDLNLFNVRAEAAYGFAIGWGYVATALAWSVVYAIAIQALAAMIFECRDVK
ncbi:MAG: hypothetical protein WC708_07890 [Lentisphaeria bacterium]